MRKLLMAILALAGASSLFLIPAPAKAQGEEGIRQGMKPDGIRTTRAARLRLAADPGDPDTVWIGHVYDATFTAGGKMQAGGYGPYHVGRGDRLLTRPGPGPGVSVGANGTWDFDRFQAGETDSMQGWWPVSRVYQSGATTFPDYGRAFFGLDYGNNVNYVINQGGPLVDIDPGVGVNMSKRTFGVVGLWHRDRGNITYAPSDTIAGHSVQNVSWAPTEVGGGGSTASAWMGMRCEGDQSHIDDVTLGGTGNAFNASLLQYNANNGFNQVGSRSSLGTDHNFPGYGGQCDQMLYRDVDLTGVTGLNISFNFSTNMSTDKNQTSGREIGWFDKDPVSDAHTGLNPSASPTSDGNFISASVNRDLAPCDSFMVYVGAPVNDANVKFSAPLFVGVTQITTVYDPRRRWFSEVLRCGAGDVHYREIMSKAGTNAAQASGNIDVGALYASALADIKTASGNKVRIVFRVKTNRGFDDENGTSAVGFSSGTRGAAIVDNVVVNGWAAANGNFENSGKGQAGVIDNDTAVSPLNAWKSTGKPPAAYFHVHSILPSVAGHLVFDDPCGGVDNPARFCDLYGNVLTPGDHDAAEKDGGPFNSNTQDRQRVAVSPTINLRSSGNGAGFYNAMGIDDEIATTVGDYEPYVQIFDAGFVNAITETGNFYSIGWQSWPARQTNGARCWGEARFPPFIAFYGPPQACFDLAGEDIIGAKANSLIRTVNANDKPDSLRLYIHRLSRCYSFTNLVEATCSPISGALVGTYFDNVSVALRDGVTPPGISIDIWNLINDAFPINPSAGLIPSAFDTCAAEVRIGLNIAAATGNTQRPAVTGDSVIVLAAGDGKRLDMIFRVLPGPGNYMTTGSKSSGVAKRPDGKNAAGTFVGKQLATASDGTFFGEYMANAGPFGWDGTNGRGSGTPTHTGKGPGGTNWSQHIWNSARMDTVEANLFPTKSNGSIIGLVAGAYASMYHESDPKFATLGVSKNRCYMIVPTGQTNDANIVCIGAMPAGAYPASSGWDGTQTTKEYTKIIPDGLLTPGSHVQYFFRKSDSPSGTTSVEIGPDTNLVFQGAEPSTDGHRWQQFGVLPDRWKDGAWSVADRNAAAPACMLYVDWCDRRGPERMWVSVADTIGATSGSYSGGIPTGRWGAHNGWHARGDQDITVPIGLDNSIAVRPHGGQPGTIWDMFGVKASESSTTSPSFGSRAAALPPPGQMQGKENQTGPTGDMLRNYYRIILSLTGDLQANIGPYTDKSDDDVGLLNDFLKTAGGTPKPRGLWMGGDEFVNGQVLGEAGTNHPGFMTSAFSVGLAGSAYRTYAANTTDVVDLIPIAPLTAYDSPGGVWGVLNNCLVNEDVLTVSGSGQVKVKYPDTGVAPNPKAASVFTPDGGGHSGLTMVDGFDARLMGNRNTLLPYGTRNYFLNVFTILFGSLNCNLSSNAPVAVGENPNNALVYFLALRSENPFRSGMATITFGITRKEKVELRVYDVAGRLVKTLANREFLAGEHKLQWDGSSDDGRLVPRGVYFYQLRTPSFVSQKKLAVLKD